MGTAVRRMCFQLREPALVLSGSADSQGLVGFGAVLEMGYIILKVGIFLELLETLFWS